MDEKRYIDFDTAVNGLAKIIIESDMPEDWNKGMSAAVSALFRIPAADVRPVVLCRDCWRYFARSGTDSGYCALLDIGTSQEAFCSNGDREEN